jgi:Pro-kumamolisin, activation domain/IPT/TIG domain
MPSGAQPSAGTTAVRLTADAPPPLPRGSAALGALAPGSTLRLDVTLTIPDPAALKAFIAAVSDRRSPLFHQFLRRGQFGARFGPAPSAVAAVRTSLQRAGLSPGPVTADRLAIPVTASAAAVERAFGVRLLRYRLPGGRVAYTNSTAPRLPAAVAPYVSGVLGLNDLYPAHSMLARPAPGPAGQHRAPARTAAQPHASGPRPCAAASTAAAGSGSFTADQLASHYGMSPLYGVGDLGQGVRVALLELEPNSASDISAYESCYGLHNSVTYTPVDGFSAAGAGAGEAALDIENVIGLAPEAAVDVYQAPNSSTAVYDTYHKIVMADRDQAISTSWGECELYSDPTLITSEHTVFEAAAAQGQSVFAAAGDSGSTDCFPSGGPNASSLSVDDPASQPNVIGVGGTSIGQTSETVWNDSAVSGGAGGGGLSAVWCMPSYQYQPAIPGLISAHSHTSSRCAGARDGSHVRQVPDVSAGGDPATGYVIYYSGNWLGVGGTSAAAPLWAAVAALIDASPFCADYGSRDAGVRPAALYRVAGLDHSYIYSSSRPEALHDVTRGNNDYAPSTYTRGLFPATTGYDMASGLGTPLVSGIGAGGRASTFYPGLAALMCRYWATKLTSTKVTGISPRQGPLAGGQKITVTGSGFLPIAGADMAEVGSTWVAATCTTSAQCTLVTPRHIAGTVNIRISAEDFTPSAVSTADRYQYVAAPKITSLTPNHGAPRGGNTVMIRGSNFIGVTSVHFASNLATHVRVVSTTEITVTVPAGSGTVNVTVTAAGGTSAASLYRY